MVVMWVKRPGHPRAFQVLQGQEVVLPGERNTWFLLWALSVRLVEEMKLESRVAPRH